MQDNAAKTAPRSKHTQQKHQTSQRRKSKYFPSGGTKWPGSYKQDDFTKIP
jgi:hypothetical protein